MNNFVIWSHAVSIGQFAPGGIRRPFHKLDYSTQLLLLLLLQYGTYGTNLSIYRLQIVKESPSFVFLCFFNFKSMVPLLNGGRERRENVCSCLIKSTQSIETGKSNEKKTFDECVCFKFPVVVFVEGSCGCCFCCCGFLSLRWRAAPLCSFCSFLIVE